MPIYEYLCLNCNKKFECLLRAQGSKAVCPHCGSADLKKLISGFAFTSGEAAASASSKCSGCTSRDCSSCS